MFRLFSMADDGRLFQLGSAGWKARDGASFPNLTAAVKFLKQRLVPALPDGQFMRDSFVALVEPNGAIRMTFDYADACDRCAAFAESEG
jgi:hypothetical protein